jgi:3-oxoacyl-[acyl-carrier-protein] synthase II
MAQPSCYDYLYQDLPGADILAVLQVLPKRWGRMDRISRLAVVEVGRVLRAAGWRGKAGGPYSGRGGLIGLTRRGSLATDRAYGETLKQGVAMASPILFSYTLANIALAEAAGHYGLTGPVYSVFTDAPGTGGEAEANRWLNDDTSLDFMIVGELDLYPVPPGGHGGPEAPLPGPDRELVAVNFRIVS